MQKAFDLKMERDYDKQVNRIFVPGETHTLGNPLVEALKKDAESCEVACYTYDKEKGSIRFSIRATKDKSAVVVLRKTSEDLLKESRQLLLDYQATLAAYVK